jgi:cell division protein ZapA
MTDSKLTIRLNIADRYYPLTINRLDESRVRKAALLINEAIKKYRLAYSTQDDQDYLAMVAVQYASKLLETKERVEIENFFDDLHVIDNKLSAILSANEE